MASPGICMRPCVVFALSSCKLNRATPQICVRHPAPFLWLECQQYHVSWHLGQDNIVVWNLRFRHLVSPPIQRFSQPRCDLPVCHLSAPGLVWQPPETLRSFSHQYLDIYNGLHFFELWKFVWAPWFVLATFNIMSPPGTPLFWFSLTTFISVVTSSSRLPKNNSY